MSQQQPKPIRGTIAIDSLGELARLTFAKDMGKTPSDIEMLRAVNNYPGAIERICILMRKLKEFRKAGWEVVVIAHESLDRIYATGGMIGKKGQPPPEPIAVKGLPQIPGNTGPAEVMKAMDNVFHVRLISGKWMWVARTEAIGPGANNWEVKDRFGAILLHNGYLPPNYMEVAKLASANPECDWYPPYLWLIYGPAGSEKTRSLRFFPKPIELFDVDGGSSVLRRQIDSGEVHLHEYNSEDHREYNRLLPDLVGLLEDPKELATVKKALGVR